MKKTVVAVIPAFNEELTIEGVIYKTSQYVDKIIVVDDCSKDATYILAKKRGVTIIRHDVNKGLGTSLRDGFGKALEMGADIIISIDADGQHEPSEIPKFINKINQGYDFVLGERDLRKYPFIKKFGNFFLNAATNFISGTNLMDTEGGFRAFSKSGLKKLYLKSERYEIATEIIFEVGRNKLRSANVPVKSPIYVSGVNVFDGVKNFIFLMHRRERHWFDYISDFKYVLRKWL
ncbi:hypothetical protein CL614_04830 [archaeon]|nr:hypothetical protein [archaeon]|tara:strand:+ start:2191 stop:2892 length:702 start_codon:yes stop_codon:yes gene_type:complete